MTLRKSDRRVIRYSVWVQTVLFFVLVVDIVTLGWPTGPMWDAARMGLVAAFPLLAVYALLPPLIRGELPGQKQ